MNKRTVECKDLKDVYWIWQFKTCEELWLELFKLDIVDVGGLRSKCELSKWQQLEHIID